MKIKKPVNLNLEIELYEEDGKQYIYMTTPDATGVKYEITDTKQLGTLAGDFIHECYEEALNETN